MGSSGDTLAAECDTLLFLFPGRNCGETPNFRKSVSDDIPFEFLAGSLRVGKVSLTTSRLNFWPVLYGLVCSKNAVSDVRIPGVE